MIDQELSVSAVNHAMSWFSKPVEYSFTDREKLAISKAFTNPNQRVFFIHTLPPSITGALLSMYSRLENERGIRGHFVDNLLPLILLGMSELFNNSVLDLDDLKLQVADMQKVIKQNNLNSLDTFCNFSEEFQNLFENYCACTNNPEYWQSLAASPRIRHFLALFLDKYGHNSIARPVMLTFCVEETSILAVKSLEWVRPGAGYIELSTRFVPMDKAKVYPIWNEIEDKELALAVNINITNSLSLYQKRMQDGELEKFFAETHKHLVPENELKAAVKGEVCDLLGNLLPAATLTSVGVSVSGESFSSLVKHLRMENTPETWALANAIIAESKKVGGNQFLNHLEITKWQENSWTYLNYSHFLEETSEISLRSSKILDWNGPSSEEATKILNVAAFDLPPAFSLKIERGPFDKLPNQFEYVSGFFRGVMSFRGWRDLHRQGFCAHFRTRLTPHLGFYRYDKPMPEWLRKDFEHVHKNNQNIYAAMQGHGISEQVREYALALGNLVGFQMGGNLLQMEFVCWQRSKFSVNHEVRQIILDADSLLNDVYGFWRDLARTDRVPVYVFARTLKGIPMMSAEPVVLH